MSEIKITDLQKSVKAIACLSKKYPKIWISSRVFFSQQISKHYRATSSDSRCFSHWLWPVWISCPPNFVLCWLAWFWWWLAGVLLSVQSRLVSGCVDCFIPDGILRQKSSYLNRGMGVVVFAFGFLRVY